MFTFLVTQSLRNRLLVLALAVILVIAGAYSVTKLPVDVFPDLNRPRVVVMTEAPGMAPEEVESLITFPIETALNGLEDVDHISSNSSAGLASISVQFQYGTDPEKKYDEVMRELNVIRPNLPSGITLLRADRAKLLCAASHLITNALRHSPDGAVVRICVRLQPGDSLVLSIHDTGEGIASTQLAHIRDALTSESAYLNVESGGIGLGLSLAKELAELHQGRVVLDSIRKKGTVAALVLPIERVTQGIPRKRREMIAD